MLRLIDREDPPTMMELRRCYLPRCRRCGQHAAAPPMRGGEWYGPANATLACGVCGHGWVASGSELMQHARAADQWREECGELEQALPLDGATH